MLKSLLKGQAIQERSPVETDLTFKKIIRLIKLPPSQRTEEETQYLSQYLKNFEIFTSKESNALLDDSLRQAAFLVKYIKLTPGQFLYHIDQPSDCVFMLLKGEAWRFRAKTAEEFRLEGRVQPSKSADKTPKILETIKLAQASKNREKGALLSVSTSVTNSNITQSTEASQKKPKPKINCLTIEEKKSSEVSRSPLNTGRSAKNSPRKKNSKSLSTSVEKTAPGTASQKLRTNVFMKIKQNRDVINFENNYLASLIKREAELCSKYLDDGIIGITFDKKCDKFECLGEKAMNLNHPRTESVMAYTELYALVLNQKSYEMVFANQIKGIQERINYFLDFFTEVRGDWLKRFCFLFEEKTFHLGDIIYRQSDSIKGVYFIKSGDVHVNSVNFLNPKLLKGVKTSKPETINSARQTKIKLRAKNIFLDNFYLEKVASLGPGQFFGEEPLFHNRQREFSAKSNSNVVCYVIPVDILHKLPQSMIQKLVTLSKARNNWRGDYLTQLKTKYEPYFADFKLQINPGVKVSSREYLFNLKKSSSNKLASILKPYQQQQIPTAPNSSRKFEEKKPKTKKVDMRKYRFRYDGWNEKEESSSYSQKLEKEASIGTLDMKLSIWKKNLSPKIFPSGRSSVDPRPPSNSRVFDDDKYCSPSSRKTENSRMESPGCDYQMQSLKQTLRAKFKTHVKNQAFPREHQVSPSMSSDSSVKYFDPLNTPVTTIPTETSEGKEPINVKVRKFLEQHSISINFEPDSMKSSMSFSGSPKTPQFSKRSNLFQQTFNQNQFQAYGFSIPIRGKGV